MTAERNPIEYGPEPWLKYYWKSFIAGVEPDWRGKGENDNVIGFFVKDPEKEKFLDLRNQHIVELRYTRTIEFEDTIEVTAVKYGRNQ